MGFFDLFSALFIAKCFKMISYVEVNPVVKKYRPILPEHTDCFHPQRQKVGLGGSRGRRLWDTFGGLPCIREKPGLDRVL